MSGLSRKLLVTEGRKEFEICEPPRPLLAAHGAKV